MEIKKNEDDFKPKKVTKMAAVYLGVILVLTFLSSAIDDFFIPEVTLIKPVKGNLTTRLEMNGSISFAEKKKVYSPCDIQVMKLRAKPGDKVTAGMPLADIKPEALELKADKDSLRLLQLENDISRHMDEYKYRILPTAKKRINDKMKQMEELESKMLADKEDTEIVAQIKEEYNRVLSELDLAKREGELYEREYKRILDQKQKELSLLKKELEAEKTKYSDGGTIVSCISGTVLSVSIQEGRNISEGQVMFEILEEGSPVEIQCDLSPEQAGQINIGDELTASLKEYVSVKNGDESQDTLIKDKTYSVMATSIQFDDKVQGVRLKCSIIPIEGVFMEGESVKLAFQKNSAIYDVLIPNSAVIHKTDGDYIFCTRVRYGWLGKQELVVDRMRAAILGSDLYSTAIEAEGLSGLDIIGESNLPLEVGLRVKAR